MIVSADHVHVGYHLVFHSSPENLQYLVAIVVSRVVNVRVVKIGAALAKKVS
jgi:hypothetical protein